MKPICFVLMPAKAGPSGPRAGGTAVDFDAVYAEIVAPAMTSGMSIVFFPLRRANPA